MGGLPSTYSEKKIYKNSIRTTKIKSNRVKYMYTNTFVHIIESCLENVLGFVYLLIYLFIYLFIHLFIYLFIYFLGFSDARPCFGVISIKLRSGFIQSAYRYTNADLKICHYLCLHMKIIC